MQELDPFNVVVIFTPVDANDASYECIIEHSHCVYATSSAAATKGLLHLYKDVKVIAVIFGDDDE